MIGGGSMPEQHVNSYSLSIDFDSLSINASQFSKKVINKPTPLIGRVKDNKFILPIPKISNLLPAKLKTF